MRSRLLALAVATGCGAPATERPPETLSNTPVAASTGPVADAGPPIEGPYVRGEIRIHPKARSRVVANGAVFVIVKRVVDGEPRGVPLAVDKLAWAEPLPFTLTTEHAMVPDSDPWGDVIVTARYDQDADAMSKEPGDVWGSTRVHAPADGVVVVLDDVIP